MRKNNPYARPEFMAILPALLLWWQQQQQHPQALPAPTTPEGNAAVLDGTYFVQPHISPANHPFYPQTPEGQGINPHFTSPMLALFPHLPQEMGSVATYLDFTGTVGTPIIQQGTPLSAIGSVRSEDLNAEFTSPPASDLRETIDQGTDSSPISRLYLRDFNTLPARGLKRTHDDEEDAEQHKHARTDSEADFPIFVEEFIGLADLFLTPAVAAPMTPGTARTNWGPLTPSALSAHFEETFSEGGTSEEASSDDGDKKPSADDVKVSGETNDDFLAELDSI